MLQIICYNTIKTIYKCILTEQMQCDLIMYSINNNNNNDDDDEQLCELSLNL